jgi:hypothetical protein
VKYKKLSACVRVFTKANQNHSAAAKNATAFFIPSPPFGRLGGLQSVVAKIIFCKINIFPQK